jgi:hypothetical protein
MPYKFTFEGPEANFQCNLICEQCAAHSASGARCKRVVCIGLPYCWQHMRSVSHVAIRDTTNGKGLFAWAPGPGHVRVFRTGDRIVDYTGEHITSAQGDQRYGKRTTAPYGLSAHGHNLVDAACKRSDGSIANAPRGTNKSANAEYAFNNHNGTWSVKAKTAIYNGQEILVGYGSSYWKTHRGTHGTKRR